MAAQEANALPMMYVLPIGKEHFVTYVRMDIVKAFYWLNAFQTRNVNELNSGLLRRFLYSSS